MRRNKPAKPFRLIDRGLHLFVGELFTTWIISGGINSTGRCDLYPICAPLDLFADRLSNFVDAIHNLAKAGDVQFRRDAVEIRVPASNRQQVTCSEYPRTLNFLGVD